MNFWCWEYRICTPEKMDMTPWTSSTFFNQRDRWSLPMYKYYIWSIGVYVTILLGPTYLLFLIFFLLFKFEFYRMYSGKNGHDSLDIQYILQSIERSRMPSPYMGRYLEARTRYSKWCWVRTYQQILYTLVSYTL